MLNDVSMSHLSVFKIFWKYFLTTCFLSNIDEVFSGDQEKGSSLSGQSD